MKALLIFILALTICTMTKAQNVRLKVNAHAAKLAKVEYNVQLHDALTGELLKDNLITKGRDMHVLESGRSYILSYACEGYITKSIRVNVPLKLYTDVKQKCEILLQEEPEGDMLLAYDGPVGIITILGEHAEPIIEWKYDLVELENTLAEEK